MSIISLFFAASLSLTSQNDYIYVQFPTNGTVDIQGLGTGPEGLYRMPRREDEYFLAEATREREVVCTALTTTSVRVETNTYEKIDRKWTPVLPSYDATLIQLAYNWKDWHIYGTNKWQNANIPMKQMVVPYLFRSLPIVFDGYYSYNRMYSLVDTCMFVSGVYNVSRKFAERMLIDEDVSFPLFPSWNMMFGFVTNAYVDVVANTSPIYYQDARSGQFGEIYPQKRTYDKDKIVSSFNFSKGVWSYSDLEEWNYIYTNGSPYGVTGYYYSRSATGYKSSYIAQENGARVSSIQDSYISVFETRDTNKACVKFPNFLQGTVFNGVYNAYAVVYYTHKIAGTNVVNKIVIIPTTLSFARLTDDGFPIYEDNVSSSFSYFEVCRRLIDDNYLTYQELYDTIDQPDFPSVSGTSKRTIGKTNTGSDMISVEVVSYFGAANVTFHARVL